MATFGSLSLRLTEALANLRGKGRLTASDVDGTAREIRRALLDADVNLGVVKRFTNTIRERALGADVNRALNPAQQVVQIVNEELVGILGGEQRRLTFAKQPPTVIMLAGLQGAGKTTLAGKLAKWLEGDGHTPLLVAADLQRPNAGQQLRIVRGEGGAGGCGGLRARARQRRRRPSEGRPRRRALRPRKAVRRRGHRHGRPARCRR